MSDPAASASDELVPMGTWIRIDLADGLEVIGFTYLDPEAGFSAQGPSIEDGIFDSSARTIVRSPSLYPWRRLDPGQIRMFELEARPSWLEHYGPQPATGIPWGAWRRDPKLKHRFFPDYPDDLQVLAHDGGRRSTSNAPEAIWVRVTGMENDLFRGVILNQPNKLQSIKYGSEIQFMVVEGTEFPLMVTPEYIEDRPAWIIHPCDVCGLSEMFDAPSDYHRAAFRDVPAGDLVAFTALCPLCDGIQGVEEKELHEKQASLEVPGLMRAKAWWQIWN